MKRILPVLLLLLLASSGWAQRARSHGYWFAAPGAAGANGFWTTTVHAGGGGELALPMRFGVGLEGGAAAVAENFNDSLLGIASLNGYYHPGAGRWSKADPFGTVGYSLFFRRGTANAVNYGVGLNYWFRPNVAARVEFRDHYVTGPGVHWWGFRFGVSFTELLP